MEIISRLALSIEPAGHVGYDLTSSRYCHGDRQPSSIESYEALSYAELVDVVLALLEIDRPGLQVMHDRSRQLSLFL